MSELQTANTLQEEITAQILRFARTEKWETGHHIVEKTLAQNIGVSRTPVRKALEALKEKGLVELVPNKGFRTLVGYTELPEDGDESDAKLSHRLIFDRANGDIPNEVSEAVLTSRYDISRGALRRVLIDLSSEGIVRRKSGHGWAFIEELNTQGSVEESYSFRIVVECSGLREPTFHAKPSELEDLLQAHRSLLGQEAQKIDLAEWFLLNSKFHEKLAHWSGNRFFLKSVQMQNNCRRLKEYSIFHELPLERIKGSLQEHVEILEAISGNDIDMAALKLRRHLENSLSFTKVKVKDNSKG